jgi:hypothetical protein
MIRWNKWTRDYTYTYEWHEGVWRLIHKKSNRPVASLGCKSCIVKELN